MQFSYSLVVLVSAVSVVHCGHDGAGPSQPQEDVQLTQMDPSDIAGPSTSTIGPLALFHEVRNYPSSIFAGRAEAQKKAQEETELRKKYEDEIKNEFHQLPVNNYDKKLMLKKFVDKYILSS